MKRNLLVLAILLVSVFNYAQDFNKTKLDSLFTLIEENGKGMNSISIFKDGEEVYQNVIGYADVEGQLKADGETRYRVGSVSKTFTATIIMKLVTQGKLSLDTPLSTYFPEIENAEDITIEQLLRHRSGVFNFTDAPDYSEWMEDSLSTEALVAKIKDYGSAFMPDSKTMYSNANYVLLSLIAEKITGKAFAELLRQEIAQPCNLSNTYYGGKINTENKEALSYEKDMEGWEKATETDMSIPQGAGGIVSTPTDLNKFLNCLFQGKIVADTTLKQMMQIEDKYGIGMFQVPFYDKKAYGHTGGIDGFVTNAFYFPEEKIAISFASNGEVMATNDILIGVLSIYFGRDYELPEFKQFIELSPEKLDTYLGVYSNPDFPIKLSITKKDNRLYGQGTGQPEFPLDAVGDDTFLFEAAGLEVTFMPDKGVLELRQGGVTYELKRE